eukprot:TRINITY_DN4140_c0_g1_i2.p1 TRINITY_DN4140_c0_g1~~TRINITY_DN4140_c0_g1_i2.p1  ORF type:complete len:419 (-),score=115.84 TRINITY_DN4140_c0_g1_i2:182-1342(-)
MANPNATAVFVTGVSSAVDERSVSDFFAFCGKITNLVFAPSLDGGEGEAMVVFETEAAAKTAQLLSNALIGDKPIVVAPYDGHWGPAVTPTPVMDDSLINGFETIGVEDDNGGDSPEPVVGDGEDTPAGDSSDVDSKRNSRPDNCVEVSGDDIEQKRFGLPDEDRTKTSAMASLMGAGYMLGADAIAKARDVDESSGISSRISTASAAVSRQFQTVNTEYGITEKVAAVGSEVTDAARAFDEKYKVNESTRNITRQMSTSIAAVGSQAMENPTVATAASYLSAFSESVSDYVNPKVASVNESYGNLLAETSDVIERTQMERSAAESTIEDPISVADDLVSGEDEDNEYPFSLEDDDSTQDPPLDLDDVEPLRDSSPFPSQPLIDLE